MTAAALPDVQEIEHLDFDPVLPCEHHQHATKHVASEAAAYWVRMRCGRCGHVGSEFALCPSGWALCGRLLFEHLRGTNACGARDMTRDECMTILRVLNPAVA